MAFSAFQRPIRHLILIAIPTLAAAGCCTDGPKPTTQPASAAAVKPAVQLPVAETASAPNRTAAPADAGHPRIVELVSRDRIVTVTAGPSGPLYSARTKAGDVIVAETTLSNLRVAAPSIYKQVDAAASNDDRSAIHVAATGDNTHPLIADLE